MTIPSQSQDDVPAVNPCLSCGSAGRVVEIPSPTNDPADTRWWAQCGGRCPITFIRKSKAEAIEVWNRRAPIPSSVPADALKALFDICQEAKHGLPSTQGIGLQHRTRQDLESILGLIVHVAQPFEDRYCGADPCDVEQVEIDSLLDGFHDAAMCGLDDSEHRAKIKALLAIPSSAGGETTRGIAPDVAEVLMAKIEGAVSAHVPRDVRPHLLDAVSVIICELLSGPTGGVSPTQAIALPTWNEMAWLLDVPAFGDETVVPASGIRKLRLALARRGVSEASGTDDDKSVTFKAGWDAGFAAASQPSSPESPLPRTATPFDLQHSTATTLREIVGGETEKNS